MNMMAAVLVLTAMTSAAMADPGDYDDARFQHSVQAGRRVQIGNARSWNPQCQSTGGIFQVTERPVHGGLSQDTIMSAIPDGRGACSGQPATARRLFYTASSGYQGADHVGYEEIYGNGGRRHVDEDIMVTAAHIAVHEGQVLRTMPAPGTLDGQPGMSVYVADGSCPRGQVVRLTLGSVSQGIPRTQSCVRR